MSSRRPYLLRAMHEWMTDNQQTPHIVVDANQESVEVPQQYVQDGKIVLNVSFNATQGLMLGNDRVEFNARFGGQTFHVVVPVIALLGIYARETGQGMIFGAEDAPPSDTPPSPDVPPSGSNNANGGDVAAPPKRTRPQLKVVK